MRRTSDERAKSWARHLRVCGRAEGVLLVAPPAVWSLPDGYIGSRDLVSEEIDVPPGAVRWTAEDLRNLRYSLEVVGRARSLEESIASGDRSLVRYRRRDVVAIVAQAGSFADRLEQALGDSLPEVGASGILMTTLSPVPPSASLPARIRDLVPMTLRSATIDLDVGVALRLISLPDASLARRWLVAARGRWWGSHLQTLDAAASDILHADGLATIRAVLSHAGRSVGHSVEELNTVGGRGDALRHLGYLHNHSAMPGDRCDVLEILRATDAVELQDGSVSVDHVAGAAEVLRAVPPAQRDRFVAAVPAMLRTATPLQRWAASLPGSVIAEVVDLWPIPHVWDPTARSVGRYLAVLRDAKTPAEAAWMRESWVFELVLKTGESTTAILQAVGELGATKLGAARTLFDVLARGDAGVARAIDDWDRPRVGGAAVDIDAVATALAMSAAEIVAYLHHRRLAGDSEELPQSYRRLVSSDPDRQVAAIRAILDGEVDSARRSVLEGQLARLGSDHAARGRREAAAAAVAKQLRRATENYRRASLTRVLQALAVDRVVMDPGTVPPALAGPLLGLTRARGYDQQLVKRFLRTGLEPGATLSWVENQRWVERMRSRFDVDRWIGGFQVDVAVGALSYRYVTETDPIRALHLGSWFDTCLSIEDGFNRMSAVTNVVDANKHIVYGLTTGGDVAMRRLLAVTDDDVLLGYRTFAHADRRTHKAALDDLCAKFAEECGLRLGEEGQPLSLTRAFWYDDGTEEWDILARWIGELGIAEEDQTDDGSHEQLVTWARDRLPPEALSRSIASGSVGTLFDALTVDAGLAGGNREVLRRLLRDRRTSGAFGLGLIDPTGLLGTLGTGAVRSYEISRMGFGLEPRAAAAVLRWSSRASVMVQLIAGIEAASAFAVEANGLTPANVRLLRHMGAKPRVRSRAGRATGVDQYNLAALSRTELRSLDWAEVGPVTLELAVRRDLRDAEFLAAIARNRRTAATCAAAAVLGADVIPQAAKKDIDDLPLDLLVLAVERFPDTWAPLIQDSDRGRVLGHPLLRSPAGTSEWDSWETAARFRIALEAAEKGLFEPLAQMSREHPALFGSAVVAEVLLPVLTGDDSDAVTRLAVALAVAGSAGGGKECIELVCAVFAAATRDGLEPALIEPLCGWLEHGDDAPNRDVCVLAAHVAHGLPEERRLQLLATLAFRGGALLHPVLARYVRDDPGLVSRSGSWSATTRVALLTAVVRLLPLAQTTSLSAQLVATLDDGPLVELLCLTLTAPVSECPSPLQRTVLLEAAARPTTHDKAFDQLAAASQRDQSYPGGQRLSWLRRQAVLLGR